MTARSESGWAAPSQESLAPRRATCSGKGEGPAADRIVPPVSGGSGAAAPITSIPARIAPILARITRSAAHITRFAARITCLPARITSVTL